MVEDLLPSFEEMQQLLQKRAPLCFSKKYGEHVLYLFGGNHSHDPRHPQYDTLLGFWNDFLEEAKTPIVFIEGGFRSLSTSKEEAIKQWSEAGLLTFLAIENNIAIFSPEPTEVEQREYATKHCSGQDMMLYHVTSIAHQWSHIQTEETFESYISRFLEKEYPNVSFSSYCKLYEDTTNEKMYAGSPEIQKHLHPWVQASAINKAAFYSTCCRDLNLLEALMKQGKNFDIFVAYGMGHVILAEHVLRQL